MTQIQRKFNAFVEGYSTHLECEEVAPPKIMDVVETVKAGGLLGEYDAALGLQKLEAGIKLNSRNKALMVHVGLVPGQHSAITFRSANASEIDGTTENEVISITGRLNKDPGNWTANSAAKVDYKIGSILFYKHVIEGTVVHHIDLKNMIGIVNGVDQWAGLRTGLGF